MDAKTRKRLDLVRQGLETAQTVLSAIAEEQTAKACNTRNDDLASDLEDTAGTLEELAEALGEAIETLDELTTM